MGQTVSLNTTGSGLFSVINILSLGGRVGEINVLATSAFAYISVYLHTLQTSVFSHGKIKKATTTWTSNFCWSNSVPLHAGWRICAITRGMPDCNVWVAYNACSCTSLFFFFLLKTEDLETQSRCPTKAFSSLHAMSCKSITAAGTGWLWVVLMVCLSIWPHT